MTKEQLMEYLNKDCLSMNEASYIAAGIYQKQGNLTTDQRKLIDKWRKRIANAVNKGRLIFEADNTISRDKFIYWAISWRSSKTRKNEGDYSFKRYYESNIPESERPYRTGSVTLSLTQNVIANPPPVWPNDLEQCHSLLAEYNEKLLRTEVENKKLKHENEQLLSENKSLSSYKKALSAKNRANGRKAWSSQKR